MNNLMDLFIRDSRKYISQIIDSLINYEKNTQDRNLIDTAFRAVHSIKSESAYLLLTDVKNFSHTIEDELEMLRTGIKSFSKEYCDELIKKAEELQLLIDSAENNRDSVPVLLDSSENTPVLSIPAGDDDFDVIEINLENEPEKDEEDVSEPFASEPEEIYETESPDLPASDNAPHPGPEELDVSVPEDLKFTVAKKIINADKATVNYQGVKIGVNKVESEIKNIIRKEFSDFQIQLLSDSMKRGEKLHRIICDISPDSTMKYPRLYLIINNLELHTNLIKTIPSAEIIEKEDHTRITCYITTKKKYNEIYKIVNVDEVKNIQIVNLPYEYYFNQTPGMEQTEDKGTGLKTIPVKIERLDSLFVSVQEMRMSLELDSNKTGKSGDSPLAEKLEIMENNIRQLRMVTLSEEFKSIPPMIRKIAYSKGKEAEIIFNDNGIEIDRSIFEHIYDPVIHLFRNAVDHGIETVEERLEKGKNRKGRIECVAAAGSGFLSIEISDDGKGLDMDKIAEKTGYNITELKEPGRLIEILSSPGFTTKKDVDEHSGRGFGLNLVREKLSQIKGASLEIDTTPGKGTFVRLKLPDNYIARKIRYFTWGNDLIALSADNYTEPVYDLDKHLKKKSDGQLFYRDMPVYTKDGQVFSGSTGSIKNKGIIISSRGKKGLLLADRILFEQIIPVDRIYLMQTDIPFLYSMRLSGMEREYLYLDSAILDYAG
jgi:two-component system, chemotaxis family, sensor kinase CheA